MATAPEAAMMDMPQEAAPNPFSDPNTMAVYDQMRQTVSPKEFGDEVLAGASQVDPQEVAKFKAELDQLDVPMEVLDMLNNMVDEILANPDNYEQVKQKYAAMGVTEDLLPAQFDPHFFSALNMAVDQMVGEPAGAQAFARGGIAELTPISKAIANYGRNGDTMLAHITPAEARMLRRRGGAGTTNPNTGLKEYFSLGKLFKGIGNAIKSFASSTVGRVVTTVALGFFLGPAVASAMGIGAGTAAAAAVGGFVGGAGSTLLAGGNLKDALKAGAIGGFTMGAIEGFSGAPLTGGPAAPGSFSDIVGGQVDKFTNAMTPTASGIQAPAIDASGNVKGLVPTDVTQAPYKPLEMTGTPSKPFSDYFGSQPSPQSTAFNPEFPVGDPGGGFEPYNKTFADTPARVRAPVGFTETPVGANEQVYRAPSSGMADVTTNTARDLTRPADTSYFDQAKDIYNKNFSPSGIQGQAEPLARKAAADAVAAAEKTIPASIQGEARNAMLKNTFDTAYKAAMPGIVGTYGPMAAAGIGALALGGGFKPTAANPSTLKPELMKPVTQRIAEGGNQKAYYIQGLPGVKYDQYGAPIFGQNVPLPTFETGLGITSLMNPKGYAAGGVVHAGNFDTAAYIRAYPEAGEAIARGDYPSAYDYYLQAGKTAGHVATAIDQVAVDKEKEAAQAANRKLVADAKAAKKAAGFTNAYQNINAGLSYDVPAGIAATSIAARQAAFKPTMDKFTQAQAANTATLTKPYTPTVVPTPYNNTSGYTNVITPVAPPINYDTTPEFTAAQRTAIENMPKDVSKMTAMQKAGIYVNLANHNLSDQQIRNAAESTYGAGAANASDWKELQNVVGQYQQAASVGLTLPNDWTSRNAAQKIDYFNTQGTDAATLAKAGVGQADIDYMTKNGLKAPAPAPRNFIPDAPLPEGMMGTMGGTGYDPVTGRVDLGSAPGSGTYQQDTPVEKKLLNMGGIASLGSGGYPRRTGQINGPGTATSDSIPAMLSDGEFVMTAKAVRGAGKGNRRAGAKRMYALMNQLEKNAARG